MPLYYFNLRTGGEIIPDPEGTELPDEAAAREHADLVARELLRNREHKTRFWEVVVHDSAHRPCFELLLATVDDTMNHLQPHLRQTLEAMSERTASLGKAIAESRLAIQRVRATKNRAEHGIYLAAKDGQPLK